MDPLSQIGNAQDVFLAGLQSQAASNALTAQKIAKSEFGSTPGTQNMERVREAAKEFEAFFVSQMMEQMMSGLEADPMFGGGQGEEVWRSMLTQEYGKEVSKSGRLGIADHVMTAMLRAQEERTAEQSISNTQNSNTETSTDAPTDNAEALAAATTAASVIRREV